MKTITLTTYQAQLIYFSETNVGHYLQTCFNDDRIFKSTSPIKISNLMPSSIRELKALIKGDIRVYKKWLCDAKGLELTTYWRNEHKAYKQNIKSLTNLINKL
jgi:hypothetical protein